MASVQYHSGLPAADRVIIDVRTESFCRERTVAFALCLPPEHFVSPRGRLANFSGLFWLLGTAGLDGSEQITVIGDRQARRDFVAGLLFVLGQNSINVIEQPVKDWLRDVDRIGSGIRRGATRQTVFSATPRTDLLVLQSELADALKSEKPPVLLDGRIEKEYWGLAIRGVRGGHLPGAVHQPLPDSIKTLSGQLPVAYAHDAYSGFGYLARLARRKIAARLYYGGWIEWAANGDLPVDADSYATLRTSPGRELARVDGKPMSWSKKDLIVSASFLDKRSIAVVCFSMLFLVSGAWFAGHRQGRRRERRSL